MSVNVKEKTNGIGKDEKFSFKVMLTTLGSFISGSEKANREKVDIDEKLKEIKKAENSERIDELTKKLQQHGEQGKKAKTEKMKNKENDLKNKGRMRRNARTNIEKGREDKGFDRLD